MRLNLDAQLKIAKAMEEKNGYTKVLQICKELKLCYEVREIFYFIRGLAEIDEIEYDNYNEMENFRKLIPHFCINYKIADDGNIYFKTRFRKILYDVKVYTKNKYVLW